MPASCFSASLLSAEAPGALGPVSVLGGAEGTTPTSVGTVTGATEDVAVLGSFLAMDADVDLERFLAI